MKVYWQNEGLKSKFEPLVISLAVKFVQNAEDSLVGCGDESLFDLLVTNMNKHVSDELDSGQLAELRIDSNMDFIFSNGEEENIDCPLSQKFERIMHVIEKAKTWDKKVATWSAEYVCNLVFLFEWEEGSEFLNYSDSD